MILWNYKIEECERGIYTVLFRKHIFSFEKCLYTGFELERAMDVINKHSEDYKVSLRINIILHGK